MAGPWSCFAAPVKVMPDSLTGRTGGDRAPEGYSRGGGGPARSRNLATRTTRSYRRLLRRAGRKSGVGTPDSRRELGLLRVGSSTSPGPGVASSRSGVGQLRRHVSATHNTHTGHASRPTLSRPRTRLNAPPDRGAAPALVGSELPPLQPSITRAERLARATSRRCMRACL